VTVVLDNDGRSQLRRAILPAAGPIPQALALVNDGAVVASVDLEEPVLGGVLEISGTGLMC